MISRPASKAAAALQLARASDQVLAHARALQTINHPHAEGHMAQAKLLASEAKATLRDALMGCINAGSCHVSTLHQIGLALELIAIGVHVVLHSATRWEIQGQRLSYDVAINDSRAIIVRQDEAAVAPIPTLISRRPIDVTFDAHEVNAIVEPAPEPVRIARVTDIAQAIEQVYRKRGALPRTLMSELPAAARHTPDEVEPEDLTYDLDDEWAKVAA